MKINPDSFINAIIPFGNSVIKPPRIEPYPLVSVEEKKLALHNLLSTLSSWPLTNIGNLGNQEWLHLIEQSALEQVFREVVIKYASLLFDEYAFSRYQGHFLAKGNDPELLKNLYWGKCLDNAGVVKRFLNDCLTRCPNFDLNQLLVRRCEIGGLIPGLRHFAASVALGHLGLILFWDFTTPQYGNLLQPPLESAVIWGIFSSELEMQELVKSYFQSRGKTVTFEIYQ